MKTLEFIGELMDNIYYLISPIILTKLFLFTMVITNQKGLILTIASIIIIVMCSSTSVYRLYKLNKLNNERQIRK